MMVMAKMLSLTMISSYLLLCQQLSSKNNNNKNNNKNSCKTYKKLTNPKHEMKSSFKNPTISPLNLSPNTKKSQNSTSQLKIFFLSSKVIFLATSNLTKSADFITFSSAKVNLEKTSRNTMRLKRRSKNRLLDSKMKN